MKEFLIPFIVLDLIVFAIVLKKVLGLHGRARVMTLPGTSSAMGLEQFPALAKFAREQHKRIGEYMRANWSGIPEQLPSVISALLNELERDAQEQGLVVQRDLLATVLATSLRSHRIAKGRELDGALKQVA